MHVAHTPSDHERNTEGMTPTRRKPTDSPHAPEPPDESQSGPTEEIAPPWANLPNVTEYLEPPVSVPDEIKALVDGYHNKHKPGGWFSLPFDSEAAANDVHKLAKKYAESSGRTFRRRDKDSNGEGIDKKTLVFRVTNKQTRNRKPAETEREAQEADAAQEPSASAQSAGVA